jgi:DNA-binding NarL/FixJ family response regulator
MPTDSLAWAAGTTVLIADDHPIYREAIRSRVMAVIPGAECSEAASLEALVALVEAGHDFDLILLDLNMPGASGLSGLVHVRHLLPSTSVLVISATDDPEVIQRALALGAAGFLPKTAGSEQIALALHTVLRGDRYRPPPAMIWDYAPRLAEAERHAAELISRLTPQQFRICALIARGLLNKQIAWELGITEATVKVHMSTILKKLGLKNRTQVALIMQTLDDGVSRPGP